MISLQNLHSFGLPACAKSIEWVNSISQLVALFKADQSTLILGEGTNTIFVDDYLGSVGRVNLLGQEIVEHEKHYSVLAHAGENWHQLVYGLMQKGIHGLENLALIPGSVGAAPVQNIGAYGAEFADFCESVHCYDPDNNEHLILSSDECRFGYRDSVFKHVSANHLIITAVQVRLAKQWQPNLSYQGLNTLSKNVSASDIFNQVVSIRRQKLPDPVEIGNAGSFFKNPVIAKSTYQALLEERPSIPSFVVDEGWLKVPAAWLIEQCGFKGKHWEGIACHHNHPLVLTNLGNGTGQSLLTAAKEIQKTVQHTFGVHLINEVRLVGANGLVEL